METFRSSLPFHPLTCFRPYTTCKISPVPQYFFYLFENVLCFLLFIKYFSIKSHKRKDWKLRLHKVKNFWTANASHTDKQQTGRKCLLPIILFRAAVLTLGDSAHLPAPQPLGQGQCLETLLAIRTGGGAMPLASIG